MSRPELLSPAGALKNMRYAFACGADTVYAGQPRYPLRVRNNGFNHENLQLDISEAHALGKKFYVVVDIAPHNARLKTSIRNLKPVVEMEPDASITSDPGLIMLVRECFPEMPIHLSVQASAVNWATTKFWQQMELAYMILSRELSLEGIEEIRNQVPDMEIEIFAHGTLCIAYSGRCLLSGYISKHDPNQGTCTSTCRQGHNVQEGREDDVGNIVHKYEPIPVQNVEPTLGIGAPADRVLTIEEAQRPGECMTAFEDEHDTCIMNSKDLCAIAHVERLTKMGVHSLKIEGRARSFCYCARTTQVYRKTIDNATAGKPFNTSPLETPEGLAHRGYTEGFLRRHAHDNYQNYEYGYSVSDRQQFASESTGEREGGLAAVAMKNKFSAGDGLELITPQGNINFTFEHMENAKDKAMSVAPGDGYIVWIPVPQDLELNCALLMCNFSGETTRNPHGK